MIIKFTYLLDSSLHLPCHFPTGDTHTGVSYNPTVSGTYELSVYYQSEVLDGYPVYLDVGELGPRLGSPKKSFGGNGSQIGKLNDPRGVACDRVGHVIVSDSRNHRIQVDFLESSNGYR